MTLQLSAVPNGTLTVTNRATGAHRTFRVKTWRKKSRRVVEMLTGPENTRDYTAFAFLDEERRAVTLWSRFQVGDWPRLAEVVRAVLFDDAHPWRAQLDVQLSRTCVRCNRLLTTPDSIARGIGPECEQRA